MATDRLDAQPLRKYLLTTNADLTKLPDSIRDELGILVPMYDELAHTAKIHLLQSIVSRILVDSIFNAYFVGLSPEQTKQFEQIEQLLSSFGMVAFSCGSADPSKVMHPVLGLTTSRLSRNSKPMALQHPGAPQKRSVPKTSRRDNSLDRRCRPAREPPPRRPDRRARHRAARPGAARPRGRRRRPRSATRDAKGALPRLHA